VSVVNIGLLEVGVSSSEADMDMGMEADLGSGSGVWISQPSSPTIMQPASPRHSPTMQPSPRDDRGMLDQPEFRQPNLEHERSPDGASSEDGRIKQEGGAGGEEGGCLVEMAIGAGMRRHVDPDPGVARPGGGRKRKQSPGRIFRVPK